SMALIVFFRGINVGGHRAFRPSVLAKELGIYDAVNVGAAGTLVVRKPGLRAKFLAELRRKLPFEATITCCDGSDLIRLEMDNPFGTEPPPANVVQFISILSEARRRRVSLSIALPEGGEWLVRIIGSKNRLVYGVYRRHMKTIGYLGQIDKLFGAQATTRSWNTILSVVRILKAHELTIRAELLTADSSDVVLAIGGSASMACGIASGLLVLPRPTRAAAPPTPHKGSRVWPDRACAHSLPTSPSGSLFQLHRKGAPMSTTTERISIS